MVHQSISYELESLSLRVAFIAQVTSYWLRVLYELGVTFNSVTFTYELRVSVYCTSYELLFIRELQVASNCTSYELLFNYEI